MNAQLALGLPPPDPSNVIVINARCLLRMEQSQRVVVVAGLPVHHYQSEDTVAEAYAMVFLVESGFAQQREVARAFGHSERTVRRYQARYAEDGMAGLGRGAGWRKGRRRISSKRLRAIETLKQQGLSNRAVAQRLGVTEKAIRKLVGPLQPNNAGQLALSVTTDEGTEPWISLTTVEEPAQASKPSSDVAGNKILSSVADAMAPVTMGIPGDAADRSIDRMLAHLGQLSDAAPLFRDGSQISGAGVLLAIPALMESGILDISRKLYGDIGPAFYGLRTTLLTLLFMALLRIQRPEHLKQRDPAALGRLLGLDRAPEVKTLRRKLTYLANRQCANQLGAELARHRVAQRGHLMGFLYVDGHVRAYHGQHTITNAYVARRHLAMPATTDYWIQDCSADPLLVITGEVNTALTQAMPNLLEQVRSLLGDRRATIVFDRGGFSPALFQSMIQNGFDILTYRKAKTRSIRPHRFFVRKAKLDGHWVRYHLHDQPVCFLNGKLRLRQITCLSENGHQTPILTSRWDLRDIEIAYRMFDRWRQENFFKYMREEFLLDALVDYHVEPEDPTRSILNPERRVLDKQIHTARANLAKLERDFGAATIRYAVQHPNMRGFKQAHAKLGKTLRNARSRLTKLVNQRRKLPPRVEIGDLRPGAVVKLATERKHLTDLIKMIAYQAESDLLALLRPHYPRVEQEGRTLLHDLFASPGDIRVSDTELFITLAPLSSPHRTRAALALCDALNQSETIFPGSSLRIRFAVHPSPRIGLAFPGSPTHFRA